MSFESGFFNLQFVINERIDSEGGKVAQRGPVDYIQPICLAISASLFEPLLGLFLV